MPDQTQTANSWNGIETRGARLDGIAKRIFYWITMLVIFWFAAQTVMDLLDVRLVTQGTLNKDLKTWKTTRSFEGPVFQGYVSTVWVAPELEEKLPPGVRSAGIALVSADYNPTDLRAKVLRRLATIPKDILWLGIVLLLQSMLAPTLKDRKGGVHPFIKANVWRLRSIGALLLVMFLYDTAIIPQLTIQLSERTAIGELAAFVFEFSYPPLGAAILLFILAEVFAHGVRLQNDVEGLV